MFYSCCNWYTDITDCKISLKLVFCKLFRFRNAIPYLFYQKTRVLFQNCPKNLDSFKTDLDFWDCLGEKNFCLITEEIR